MKNGSECWSQETTQVSIHAIRNVLGERKQLSLFSDQDEEFSKEYGLEIKGSISRFGIDLTEIQSRVMEGILHGFSVTGYEGNAGKISVEKISESYDGKLPSIFNNISSLPKLTATQTNIFEWSGINTSSIAARSRAIEALHELGEKQFCFYYDRLVFDEKGNPKKLPDGKWQMEQVTAVDTLFTIKCVKHDVSGNLRYYEIIPSPIFLDQRETYFLMVPHQWREEVKQVYGRKKASGYVFRLLMLLRLKFEQMRRVSKDKGENIYKISWTPEEFAIALKMPESLYKKKKAKASEILEEAYSLAKSLGYLVDYKRTDVLDVLTLADEKYYVPKRSSDSTISGSCENPCELSSSVASKLTLKFYENRKILDPQLELPQGLAWKKSVASIEQLLLNRSVDDVEMVLEWIQKNSYWKSRISQPNKLLMHFSEIWCEMKAKLKVDPDEHKKWAQALEKVIGSRSPLGYHFVVCNNYVEVYGSGQSAGNIIYYDTKDFKQRLSKCLFKAGFKKPPS